MKTGDYYSPIGIIRFIYSKGKLESVNFLGENVSPAHVENYDPFYIEVCNQLEQYFKGRLREFTIPLNVQGTAFQKHVWASLPSFGHTISYGDLANSLGDINASRAVANANANNRFMLVIPCHRVIGKDGSLTGYAGGLNRKKFLLELEKGVHQGSLF